MNKTKNSIGHGCFLITEKELYFNKTRGNG